MVDGVKKSGSARGAAPSQKALPAYDERAQLGELLRQLEAGEIEPDRVVRRLKMLFHSGIGGIARALAVLDGNAARDVAEHLRQGVGALIDELGEASGAVGEPVSLQARLRNKSREVLLREQVIMRKLTSTDGELASKDILAEVRTREPAMPQATLTAHLDRMLDDLVLVRDRKGWYRGSQLSKEYLQAIASELELRR